MGLSHRLLQGLRLVQGAGDGAGDGAGEADRGTAGSPMDRALERAPSWRRYRPYAVIAVLLAAGVA